MTDIIDMSMIGNNKAKRVVNLLKIMNRLENQLIELTLSNSVDEAIIDSFITTVLMTSDKIEALLGQNQES